MVLVDGSRPQRRLDIDSASWEGASFPEPAAAPDRRGKTKTRVGRAVAGSKS